MPRITDAALREELRQAGLSAEGPAAELLALLRAAGETHLTAASAQRLAAEGGLALARPEVAALLETLARAGLLARIPVAGGAALYDTVTRRHSHLLDEATGALIDLDVSPETLMAILRRIMADQPGRVEVLLRIHPPRPGEPGAPRPAGRPGRPRAVPPAGR